MPKDTQLKGGRVRIQNHDVPKHTFMSRQGEHSATGDVLGRDHGTRMCTHLIN